MIEPGGRQRAIAPDKGNIAEIICAAAASDQDQIGGIGQNFRAVGQGFVLGIITFQICLECGQLRVGQRHCRFARSIGDRLCMDNRQGRRLGNRGRGFIADHRRGGDRSGPALAIFDIEQGRA